MATCISFNKGLISMFEAQDLLDALIRITKAMGCPLTQNYTPQITEPRGPDHPESRAMLAALEGSL